MYASCLGDDIFLHVHRQRLVFMTFLNVEYNNLVVTLLYAGFSGPYLQDTIKTLVFVFCLVFPIMNAKSAASK